MGVDFHWHGEAVTAALDAELCDRLDHAADALVAAVRQEAPVRSGALRASAHKTPVDRAAMTVSVVADAPYAGFVEDGTPRHPAPNPFFMRAAESSAAAIGETLTERR